MVSAQSELEKFLISEVGIGLSNIRAHLEWASESGRREATLSNEGAASIIVTLIHIETKARILSDRLRSARAEPVGVTETLQRLVLENAA